jgi:hypothetical protein
MVPAAALNGRTHEQIANRATMVEIPTMEITTRAECSAVETRKGI